VDALRKYGIISREYFSVSKDLFRTENTEKMHPDHYNKEVKKLKAKVRKAYNRIKSGQQYREELK
jgi:hypothetical protein